MGAGNNIRHKEGKLEYWFSNVLMLNFVNKERWRKRRKFTGGRWRRREVYTLRLGLEESDADSKDQRKWCSVILNTFAPMFRTSAQNTCSEHLLRTRVQNICSEHLLWISAPNTCSENLLKTPVQNTCLEHLSIPRLVSFLFIDLGRAYYTEHTTIKVEKFASLCNNLLF